MMLRLAFGISTATQPEILLLDEMVGAGDSAFVTKARERIEGLIHNSSIMVLASHDDHLVTKLCTRAIWMHNGRVRAFGPVAEVLADYYSASEIAKKPPDGGFSGLDDLKRMFTGIRRWCVNRWTG
jgi:ABC-type polysaccharide/polyol phosphate transport system ATPase subunit